MQFSNSYTKSFVLQSVAEPSDLSPDPQGRVFYLKSSLKKVNVKQLSISACHSDINFALVPISPSGKKSLLMQKGKRANLSSVCIIEGRRKSFRTKRTYSISSCALP